MTSEFSSDAPLSQPSFIDRGKRRIDSSAQRASSSNSVQPGVQNSYANIVEEWYVALYEEDSLRLQQLLKVYPNLWLLGWESDPKRKVKGRPRNYRSKLTESDWKGRTALHVGARRGNVALLQKVLDLCRSGANATGESNANERTRDSKAPSAILEGDGGGKERSMERLLLEKDGEYKLDAIAMAIINGNQIVVAVLLKAGSTCEPVESKYTIRKSLKSKWYDDGSDVGESDEPKEDDDGSDEPKLDANGSAVGGPDEPKKDVDGSDIGGPDKDNDGLNAGEPDVGASNVAGPDDSKKNIGGSDEPEKDVDGPDVDGSAVGGSDEPKDDIHMMTRIKQKYWDIIQELQLSQEMQQGNDPLKKDSVVDWFDKWDEERDKRKLVRDSKRQKDKDSKTPHEVMKRKLTIATRQVIESFRGDGLFRMFVLDRYDCHRDFNFLPKEEFLFHFLSTAYGSADSDHLMPPLRVRNMGTEIRCLYFVVQDAIMRAVVSLSPGLTQFLWKLHDGQGRPPLHVAVDEQKEPFSMLLNLVGASSVDENLVREILYARDGAGRTALQRSIASKGNEFLCYSGFSLASYDINVKARLEQLVIKVRTHFLEAELQRSRDHGKLEQEIEKILDNFTHGQPGEQRYRSDRMLEYVTMNFTSTRQRRWKSAVYDEAVQNLLTERESRDQQTWTLRSGTSYSLNENAVSDAHGFTGIKSLREESERTPLHTAIIHKNLKAWHQMQTVNHSSTTTQQLSQRLECSGSLYGSRNLERKSVATTIGVLELAAIIGDMETLKELLQINGDSSIDPPGHCSALQIAASLGRYDMLQLLKDKGHDPLELDQFGNSALHYALRGMSLIYDNSDPSRNPRNIFNVHLTDYVSSEQILETEKERKQNANDKTARESVNTEEILIEKQGCINMLIQDGCDIFKPNYDKEFPHPKQDANFKLHSWWQEKQTKEFAIAQNAQNTAANAISVIAALVATASYVGPLQPPLGYSDNDPTELQLRITAVKVFIICDTMSFYLAIAAIIATLVPCLPMPQQSMIRELRRTTHTINVAVAMLFPSIIFVLMAFAAASIAVIQISQTDWNRGVLTKVTASIGGFFCLIMIMIFSVRVLAIVFHNSKLIKKLYEKISYENLVDIVDSTSLRQLQKRLAKVRKMWGGPSAGSSD